MYVLWGALTGIVFAYVFVFVLLFVFVSVFVLIFLIIFSISDCVRGVYVWCGALTGELMQGTALAHWTLPLNTIIQSNTIQYHPKQSNIIYKYTIQFIEWHMGIFGTPLPKQFSEKSLIPKYSSFPNKMRWISLYNLEWYSSHFHHIFYLKIIAPKHLEGILQRTTLNLLLNFVFTSPT